jgi:hypothetical protein
MEANRRAALRFRPPCARLSVPGFSIGAVEGGANVPIPVAAMRAAHFDTSSASWMLLFPIFGFSIIRKREQGDDVKFSMPEGRYGQFPIEPEQG